MSLFSWLPSLARNRSRRASRLPGRGRPVLEMLEDRLVPTMFNVGAGDVAGLIADVNTANSNGQSNVITLTASTYDLTAINNFWYGPDGLPAISSNLAINGNGATLQRATAAGFPAVLCVERPERPGGGRADAEQPDAARRRGQGRK